MLHLLIVLAPLIALLHVVVIVVEELSLTHLPLLTVPVLLLPVTSPVVHLHSKLASPIAAVVLEASPAEASTSLKPAILVELASAATLVVHHVLLHRALVVLRLLVITFSLIVVRSAAGSEVALAAPVFKILKLFLAAWTCAVLVPSLVNVTLERVRLKTTYILLHGFHLEIAPTQLAVFDAAFAIACLNLEIFPAVHACISRIGRFFVAIVVVEFCVLHTRGPSESLRVG